jgi:hypothetical protein
VIKADYIIYNLILIIRILEANILSDLIKLFRSVKFRDC